MSRRFASFGLSVLMVAALVSQGASAVIAAGPAPAIAVQPIDAPAVETTSAVQVTRQLAASAVNDCVFCVLSNLPDSYTFFMDLGADLRVDGGIMVNRDSWYQGTQAVVRCGSSPCTPPNCDDWSPSPGDHRVQMCGTSLYVEHTAGFDGSILSAGTISLAGGWQTRVDTDFVHADQLAAVCPAHPRFLGWPPALQETNVCIGAPRIVDPLNDPANPDSIVPLPDFQELSTCPDGLCGPVASATCVAEPGSQLRLPTGTFANPQKLVLAGAANQRILTICPGLYFGGFGTNGDGSAQPHVIMLPGTYAMIGGGFSVTGTASITSVSGQGDGVSIYNAGGNVDLRTSAGPCAAIWTAWPCGQMILHAPTSGQYSGLLIFQDREQPGTTTIAPFLGAPACDTTPIGTPLGDQPAFMAYGVAPDANAVPDPCGPLGGLSGAIYAPHQSNGSPADFDAIVNIKASGVAFLKVIAAEILLAGPGTQARSTWGSAPERLVVSPSSASIAPAVAQPYTVEAFDADGNSLGDVTSSSTFGIGPDGSCTGAACSATVAGSHTVSATHAGLTATATLTVIPGPFDHLALVPADAAIAAGGVQAYTAEGRDAFDNPLGTVAGVTFKISPNGSCTNGKCTAKLAGIHTVTGTKAGLSATTTLTVTPGPLDHLVLAPPTASVQAGVAQPYTAQGRDRFNNSLGDVTAGTVFTIAPNGTCTGASCRATIPGNHTVTGVNAGKLGRATLSVKAGPLDHLALAPATRTIALGGSQAYSATGRDAFNNPLGTQSGVVYTISPDGSCNHAACTPASVGPHTVTGTKGVVTGTATLTVT